MAISFENAASQVYKLAPVVPKLNVNLPLTQIEIPGKFTSSIANFPESFAFIATTIDGVGNVIYVTDSTLTQKSTLKLPRTAAGEKFVSFVACKREVGTVFIVSTDSSNNLVLRKAGNKVNRVRIFHRKTGLVVTMALDSKVILFPLDETTKNQQFDRSLFTNTFRNVQLDRALTTRGRPFRYSTYEQERGFKLIGEPYRQENRFQRFAFSNGRIISLKDKKCLGIDRNFLVNGRWPRTFTGLPLITVPCSTDKLQVFDIARAI
ncbi:hypothetical protein BC829DRAFT_195219 [Chytridium lagenaria]|nr:hypothetical protein BC829DRAFT_195219 [Chytridium lagenaria]